MIQISALLDTDLCVIGSTVVDSVHITIRFLEIMDDEWRDKKKA